MIELATVTTTQQNRIPRDGAKWEPNGGHVQCVCPPGILGEEREKWKPAIRAFLLGNGFVLLVTKDGTTSLVPPGGYGEVRPLESHSLEEWSSADASGNPFSFAAKPAQSNVQASGPKQEPARR